MQQSIQKSFSHFLGRHLNDNTFQQLQIRPSAFVLLLLLLSNPVLFAQHTSLPEEGSLVKSMGLPQIWKPYFGPMVAWDKPGVDGEVAGEIDLGVYKNLIIPLVDVLGVVGEGYVRSGGDKVDGGVRLLGASRFLFIQGGADYSFRNKDIDFLMSFMVPLRRGGPLRKGGNLRIDWFPGRSHSFSLGLSIPLGQPFMGKSRPTLDHVPLPKTSPPGKSVYDPEPKLRETLTNMRHAADWINRFTTPFIDQSAKTDTSDIAAFVETIKEFKEHMHVTDHLYPNGHTFEAEVDFYHGEMERAFSLAIQEGKGGDGGTRGVRIAGKAREILLDEVILPYNRLLGQRKKHDSVLGFGCRAAEVFRAWVEVSSDVPAENRAAVMYVFRSIIECIDENRASSKKVWEHSQLVWIPLHYALRFEEHDTEDELDTIIERAVKQQFTDANDVHYVINELFQPELARMIQWAEDYHVLWIHDFSGRDKTGEPDETSRQTVEAYLQALIENVRAYETTRKIPVYMIFLDQHYFEHNHSRLWLALLEDPLGHEVHLPPKFRDWEETIRKSQEDLRSAVAQSAGLQAAAQRYGEDWLANQVKVHISITNPFDLSFRSGGSFKYVSFAPDNIMRDHRKIAFYDVTELDPGKGEAIYTGMGIGKHFIGPTWDDRSILARGPALVSLKDTARELLLSQGFDESEIPAPLRPLPKPDNYADLCQELRAEGWTASAMQVHNTTGFGLKSTNIIKAVLYNLMPKGSHLYIPDSLWNSPFWGAMLVGAALRGCVVLVVSPALKNAPSFGIPAMSRANELFTRFVIIQSEMCEEIESAGGLFKTGIYNMDVDVGDIVGKLRVLNHGIAQSKVFREVFPFDSSVAEMIAGMPDLLVSQGFEPSYRSEDAAKRKPKLHLKSQFFASKRTIDTVVPMEGWVDLVRKYILARAKQITDRETYADVKDLREALSEDAAALIVSWGEGLTPQERGEAILYLTVGSHNQDYRSMIMDGEVLFVVGRTWAMIAYLDFVSLIAQTTWVNDVQQLEELLPRHRGFWKWLGRYLKLAI